MRIERINFTKSLVLEAGIKPTSLERLGSVVALIGRNGAGKTRVLDLISDRYVDGEAAAIKIFDESLTHLPQNLASIVRSVKSSQPIGDLVYNVHKLKEISKLVNEEPQNEKLQKEAKFLNDKMNEYSSNNSLRADLQNIQGQIPALDFKVRETLKKYIIKIRNTDVKNLQKSIPQNVPNQAIPIQPFEGLMNNKSEEHNYNEFASIKATGLTFLSTLANKLASEYVVSTLKKTDRTQTESFRRFSSLQNFVKKFLKKDLEWEMPEPTDSPGVAGGSLSYMGLFKIGGRPFNYDDFSEGEKTLFTYCLLFFLIERNPEIQIKDCILVIDEPELHLHPESEIALVNGLREVVEENGQLWIATHSLNILAHLKYEEIFIVKDNAIIPPISSNPPNAIDELMGLGEYKHTLSTFLHNISNWSYENFVSQCFINPEVIESAKPNDPQVEVLKKAIMECPEGSSFLDFGAGTGRVLKNLMKDNKLQNKLSFSALDISETNRIELKKLGIKEVYKDSNELKESSFDFIFVCNVLHELPILKWPNIIANLRKSLKTNGFIILVEDMLLPHGEKIEDHGFLVLDSISAKSLFNMESEPLVIKSSLENFANRILCCVIQKEQIGEISNKSIKNALSVLQKNTFDRIKNLPKDVEKEDLHRTGRASAFYSKLYINCGLAIEMIKE